MFIVYVLKSQLTGKIYIGQTANLERRLERHNGILPSKPGSYTRINKGVWEVVYQEKYGIRKQALKREKYLKSHVGRDWLRNIILAP